MKKLSQKQIAYLYLYYHAGEWVAPWDLMGELTINGKHYFGSYKMAARLSDLAAELPKLVFERKKIIGISGAKYFCYRMKIKFPISFVSEYYQNAFNSNLN